MLDFLLVSTRSKKKDVVEVYPKFVTYKVVKGRAIPSTDLMTRNGDFYAVWVEEDKLWSTDEIDVLWMIDRELDAFAREYREHAEGDVRVAHMWDAESGSIDAWHKYCQKQRRASYHTLDETLIFSNMEPTKEDYASKKLSYPLEKGDLSAYDKLMSTLYSPEERDKIEWAIGSIVTGDSKFLQKFLVFYGAAGTGKSTVLNIIQKLFDGYSTVFDAKSLGSSNKDFALEPFRSNPLVAIQHDGDLSHIEDNTRLNSLVSHELMTVNVKFQSAYPDRFKCFLFMGTNRPVRITDAKSGLIRRLIDVSPSGDRLSQKEYDRAMAQIDFELGAIAYHCREVYLDDPGRYNHYVPIRMLGASNDFYNFVLDSYFIFEKEDSTTLTAAWERYKNYCEEARVAYPLARRPFQEELKNYFEDYKERCVLEDGSRPRSYYSGFRKDIFSEDILGAEKKETKEEEPVSWLQLEAMPSLLDRVYSDCPAQYATDEGTPVSKWANVTSVLSDLDTTKTHYVKIPENHIVIDFDIPDENGGKSLERNLAEASQWPPTYAELSKSGKGIHLHYIYPGDPSTLSRIHKDHVEVKVFTGNSSLRRRLSLCNAIPIAVISSGLALRKEKKVVDIKTVQSENHLRELIKKNLKKEIHPNTKPSVDFIKKILDDAYASGMRYDVSDMRPAIIAFASQSTNSAQYCLNLVTQMKFQSEEDTSQSENLPADDISENKPLVIFDVEVFPNLSLVCWKFFGNDKKVVRIFNPKPADIEKLLGMRLIGFNCRRYDNHILYALLIGKTTQEVYKVSQDIISDKKSAFFREAYNFSYTDIYDFSSLKQSLKKFEIDLGINHQELGLPWDQDVPENMWDLVADYCENDVLATEAVFNARGADWTARLILSDLAKMTPNDTTNSLTTRIIFGNERNPQRYFNYRNLADPVMELDEEVLQFLGMACPDMMSQFHGEAQSLLPYFPGYTYEKGVSTYKGRTVGEGGRVYAEPGIYYNVALLDIASMHPHSIIAECLFGVKFTTIFRDIVEARVEIKHEDWEVVSKMLEEKLVPYIQKVQNGEITSKDLANALKIAINSVYGLTAARFENAFHDIRNIDNIVAKRGALFMVDLEEAVRAKGFTVAHIKTDSIKIPDATPEIIQFVMDFGKRYGYTFEHEATYERMCLVNDAVYIAKYADTGEWTATGTQFQVPYVFKSLFSKEDITFDDLCETKSVTSALYLKAQDPAQPEFIGRVSRFCPIKPGCGGKELLREGRDKDGNVKYSAATGTKGYFWLESETVKALGKEEDIDRSYYDKLVDDAIDAISKYGDFEQFVNGEVVRDIPPWESPDDPWNESTAFDVR